MSLLKIYRGSNSRNLKEVLAKAKENQGMSESRNCRICLDESDTPENPFISPCKCDGSMKFIHLTCLQEW
jgi:E3 ubiquitin-protein ligase DOA10